MTKFIISVAIYAGIGTVMHAVGVNISDWQYWAVFALAIAAECNARVSA